MRPHGCARHGAVLGPCSHCYQERARALAIAKCKHFNLDEKLLETHFAHECGEATEAYEIISLACLDCPGWWYSRVDLPLPNLKFVQPEELRQLR